MAAGRNQRTPSGSIVCTKPFEDLRQVFFLLNLKASVSYEQELPDLEYSTSLLPHPDYPFVCWRVGSLRLGWFCTSFVREKPRSGTYRTIANINVRADDGDIHSSPGYLPYFFVLPFPRWKISAPVLPMKEMSALLSEAALQQADRLFARFPFEFFPSYVLFNERWQKSPFLGRFLISNLRKGWFVYVFCSVNAAVFALWQCPSLLQIPSKLHSFFQPKRQRQAKSGGESTRDPPRKRVMTIHDLNKDYKGANTDLLGSPVGRPLHWKTLDRHFLHSPDNIVQGRWWTILTGAISHRDVDHIGKNLVSFISVASMAINRGVSNGQLFCVCLGSAVAGAAAQLWRDSRLMKRDRLARGRRWIVSRGALGASGIVSGLSIAIAVAWPHTKVQMSVPLLSRPPTLPLWAVPVFSCVYDMWMLTDESSKIAHHVHLGGALFGGLYSFFAWRGFNLASSSYWWW